MRFYARNAPGPLKPGPHQDAVAPSTWSTIRALVERGDDRQRLRPTGIGALARHLFAGAGRAARLGRRRARPPRGEYPPSFTHAWIRGTLPTASPAEARALLHTMRQKGWTEAEVAQRILPYMPVSLPIRASGDAPAGRGQGVSVPAPVSTAWLDRHLPAMDRGQIRLVVEELERRGWPATRLAMAVVPHMLPKLSTADANALRAGLRELGMTEGELDRLSPP